MNTIYDTLLENAKQNENIIFGTSDKLVHILIHSALSNELKEKMEAESIPYIHGNINHDINDVFFIRDEDMEMVKNMEAGIRLVYNLDIDDLESLDMAIYSINNYLGKRNKRYSINGVTAYQMNRMMELAAQIPLMVGSQILTKDTFIIGCNEKNTSQLNELYLKAFYEEHLLPDFVQAKNIFYENYEKIDNFIHSDNRNNRNAFVVSAMEPNKYLVINNDNVAFSRDNEIVSTTYFVDDDTSDKISKVHLMMKEIKVPVFVTESDFKSKYGYSGPRVAQDFLNTVSAIDYHEQVSLPQIESLVNQYDLFEIMENSDLLSSSEIQNIAFKNNISPDLLEQMKADIDIISTQQMPPQVDIENTIQSITGISIQDLREILSMHFAKDDQEIISEMASKTQENVQMVENIDVDYTRTKNQEQIQ